MEHFIDWFGYFASAVVAISLLMTSILKLRWINMVGALFFTTYGFLIHAYPVALLNLSIAGINIYYLVKIYSKQDQFKLINILANSQYLGEFLAYHEKEILKFFPSFKSSDIVNETCFFVLRNSNVAGVFLAQSLDPQTLLITLDYVIPEFRDFKVGQFVFTENKKMFKDMGFTNLASDIHTSYHNKYLSKMGFVESEKSGKSMMIMPL